MGAKWGQVFLHDRNIVDKIMRCIEPGVPIVEIGCGKGVLTLPLSQQGVPVYVFEIDEACVTATALTLPVMSRVHFFVGDVLDTSGLWPPLSPFQVVANIPYYISAPILKCLATHRAHLTKATVMVQTEFAKKIAHGPGSPFHSSLGIYLRAHFDVHLCFAVSPRSFSPVPKVGSSVIQLIPHHRPLPPHSERFFSMVRAGFWGRRKPLASALLKAPGLTRLSGFDTMLRRCDLGSIRGEALTDDEWRLLYQQLAPVIGAPPDRADKGLT